MNRTGFTIIELLVVLSIMALLAGLGWPVLNALQARFARERTSTVVLSVATACNAYRQMQVYLPGNTDGPGPARRMWDFNGDGLLDGDPALDEAFVGTPRSESAQAGYRGFLAHGGIDIPRRHIDGQHRVIDAWGQPLRIAFGAAIYGGNVGVWSAGPDHTDSTDDDITSWSIANAR